MSFNIKDDDHSDSNASESDEDKENAKMNFSMPFVNQNSSAPLRQSFQSSSTSPLDVLYCKARGMSLDHISSNSILHFKPSEENAHGAELFCSHSVCKSKGVKFRYCAYCKKAVAKRNFRNRHAHLGLMGARSENQMYCNIINQNLFPLSSTRNILMDRFQLQERSTLSDITDSNVNVPSGFFGSTAPTTHPALNKIMDSTGTMNQQLVTSSHFISETKTEDPIPSMWLDLYRKRPIGGGISEVRSWQQKIMSFLSISPRNSGELSHVSSEDSTGTIVSNPVRAVKKEFEGIAFNKLNSSSLHVNTENFDYDCISLLDSKGSVASFPYGML